MAVGYNPRAVTDGLVLALDAGNPKNYNAGISTNWTDKVGGNNGTLVGGTHHTDGPFVGAGYVEFVKSDNDGFTISNSTGWFNPNNTSQWTLEGWILNPSSTNSFWIYSGTWGSIANFGCSIGGGVAFQSGDGAWAWVTNSTIVADTGSPTGWNHFAFTKNGSTFEVFLNGSRIYTGTPTFGTGTTGGSIHLQSYFSNPIYYSDAAGLSNVRYVTGSVLYSGTSYTVPTKPFTAIGGTQLLIYQGNTFTDASSNSLTLTKQNSPTANLGFPKSAFVFDGSNDYVDIGASSDFNFGTGNFTIEGWVNSSTFSVDSGAWRRFFKLDGPSVYNASGQLELMVESTNGNLYIAGNSLGYNSLVSVANGSWNHFAVTRVSNTIYVYVNGVSAGSVSYSGSFSPNSGSPRPRIGAYTSTEGRFNGKVSALKIYKGKGLTAAEVTQNYNATKGRYA